MGKYKYQSVEQVQQLIDQYFISHQESEKPLTITGLALALDFNSTQEMWEYQDRSGKSKNSTVRKCANAIKKAKSMVELSLEERVYMPDRGMAVAGNIFGLKAKFGWREQDQQQVERIEITFAPSGASKGKPKDKPK